MSALTRNFRRVLWPGLLAVCIYLNALGLRTDHPVLIFNLIYFGLAFVLFALERAIPFEKSWLQSDREEWTDFLHTFFNKGGVQVLIRSAAILGFAASTGTAASGIWPHRAPLAVQVILGLVVTEFGFYWSHRLGHEWPPLWRFHKVHHSVKRLWFFNTGRFHFGNTLAAIVFSQPLLYLAGAPQEIFMWVGAITAFIGILTHCNIDMHCGVLSYAFNTPNLHRWHHSMNLDEGNKNYGENLMLFDHLFGTYFWSERRPPTTIGIAESIPSHFLGQLRAPFAISSASFSNTPAIPTSRLPDPPREAREYQS